MDYWKTHGFPNLPEGFIDNQFDHIDPERHKELSKRGGIASGQTRRRQALLHDYAMDVLARQALAQSATDEFTEAVHKVMKAERKKRRRRKGGKSCLSG